MLKLSWNIFLSLSKHSKLKRAINVLLANSPVGVTDYISPSFRDCIWR